MKIWLTLFFTLLQITLASVAFAAPKIPSAPTTSIYVQDYANVLSTQTENYINSLGADLDKKTTAQITVVTIPSLEGASIDEYALDLFRTWGIGDKTKNNGVLMLIAVNDHKSRIEVGYGLEGALNDGLTGKIQDQYMIPYFKNNNYNQGTINGYTVLNQLAAKEYNVTVNYKQSLQNVNSSNSRNANNQYTQQNPTASYWSTLSTLTKLLIISGLIIFFIIDNFFFRGFFLGILFSIIRTLFYLFLFFGGRGGGGGFGGGGFGGGSSGGGGSNRSW
jgi:uncharacterized protein